MNRGSFVFSPRAYHSFLANVIEVGAEVAPRGEPTLEILNGSLTLRNPIDRVIPDRGRKMNIAFGVAEWYAMMFGINDVAWFERFIGDYGKYSSDGKTLDGAYGTRINREGTGDGDFLFRQINGVISTLASDPLSRRAVIAIYDWMDLFGGGGVNTPCTLSLQFLIRDDKLHMVVNMRSSDVVRGLTYDCFVFTMIQEYIARILKVELGSYIHNAGSLHIYASDLPLVARLSKKRWPYLMDAMPYLGDDDMRQFRDIVNNIDQPSFFSTVYEYQRESLQGRYLSDLALVMKAFVDRKTSPDNSATAYDMLHNGTLRYVTRPWLVSAGVLKERAGAHEEA